MKMLLLPMRTRMVDTALCLPGHITHTHIGIGGKNVIYSFQPEGINPENGCPHRSVRTEEDRIENYRNLLEEVHIPTEILGTNVTDKLSGFTGMAIGFVRHVNGCFHVIIQPPGLCAKTQTPYPALDFDLRQCRGEAIKELTPDEVRKSEESRPSPCDGCDYNTPGI